MSLTETAVTPAAPAAAEPTPTPTPTPPVDKQKAATFASVLGLVDPQAAVAPAEKPPEPKPVEAAPAPTPTPTPEPKPADPKPKKIAVTKKTSVQDEVRRALEEQQRAAPAPTPTPAAPAPAAAVPVEEDLTPEEREEVELAEFAAKKDPGKKDLPAKFRTFYKKQKEFLEAATAKAIEDGEDYDPTQDPKYKQFLAAHEPKIARAERQRLFKDMITEQAKAEALKETEARFAPKLDELDRKARAVEKRPEINKRLARLVDDTAEGMPAEILAYHKEVNGDPVKLTEAFPLEFPIIQQHVAAARNLAETFLNTKNGLIPFNPEKNDHQRFLNQFVMEQGNLFAKHGGELLVRDGKTFIKPQDWAPGLEARHWTFDEDDILEGLKLQAQKEAKARIAQESERLKKLGYERKPKPAAPNSAPAVVPTPKPDPVASPRTPTAPIPGSATPAAGGSSPLLKVLGY